MKPHATARDQASRQRAVRWARILVFAIWAAALITTFVIVPVFGFKLLPEMESYKYSKNEAIMRAGVFLGLLPFLLAPLACKLVFKLTHTTEDDLWSQKS